MEPISDKAEVSIDFPDKFYSGSFSRGAKFEARSENDGLFIKLEGFVRANWLELGGEVP